MMEVSEKHIPPCIAFRGVQTHTYSLYTYICSPFEVLEKGRHALQTLTQYCAIQLIPTSSETRVTHVFDKDGAYPQLFILHEPCFFLEDLIFI